MESDRQRILSNVYRAARERHGDDRARFLREACPDDDLRAEIESLLSYEDEAKRFLDTVTLENLSDMTSQGLDAAPATGERMIGSYKILSLIGAGGMGRVYRARDTRLGRDVALKILSPRFTADHERSARFEREARLLASLNHPNIAGIYGIEDADGVRALVLELVEGETLADMMHRGRLTVDQALNIARQIGEGLRAAHRKGIIHRDLKPRNIGVTADGTVKLLDFGLAKAFLAASSATQAISDSSLTADSARMRLGTPAYMSPEQARGVGVDRKTDNWAFGCVIYEMLAGKAPFEGDTVIDILASVLAREPDWDVLLPSVPNEISRLIKHCLEKDPERRLADITEAIATLEGALRQHSASSPNARLSRSLPVGSREQRLILGLPAWLLVPLIPMAVASLGFVSSTAFNTIIGLSPRFGWESPAVWLGEGLQFLIGAVTITSAVALVIVSLRRIRRALSSRFPTIKHIDEGVSQDLRVVVVSLGLDDPYLVAPAVSILGATVLAITLWSFGDVINAFWHPINDLLPEQAAVLGPESAARADYMTMLLIVVLALALGVRYMFAMRRRTGIADRVGWPITSLVVLAIGVLFLAMPYRIMFHNRFERIRFQGNPCFVIGENRLELMLHCPTLPPPRNRTVSRDSPDLTDRSKATASIYSAPRD